MNPKSVLVWASALLFVCPLVVPAQSAAPVFKVDTNLQSIAVQVTDKQGNHMHGLTASDFTLLEEGRPQKIAFFEAESEPVTLPSRSTRAAAWISVAS